MNEEFDDDRDNHSPIESVGPGELADLADSFPPGPVGSTLFAEDLVRRAAVSLMRRKVEQVDRAVGRTMEQVPVPLGLAERLLADVQLSDEPQGVGQQAVSRGDDGRRGIGRASVGRVSIGRRGWLVSGSLVAALAAGVAWFWLSTLPPPMDYDTLIADVRDFHDQEPAAEGAPLAAGSPRSGYLYPAAVATNTATRRRPVGNLLGRAGLAYDLTSARGKRATLYVVDLNSRIWPIAIASLPTSPPTGRFTFGRTTGAWTDGKLLFVLVVEGDDSDYNSFLRRQDSMA